MPSLRRFLSRRWLLGFLAAAVVLFGLAMLHPYPRQSLFGPTIRGKPKCYWEDEVRWFGTQNMKPNSLEVRIRDWLGIRRTEWAPRSLFDHEEMLPLLLELAEDDNQDVRMTVAWAIVYFEKLHQEPALPILREQLRACDTVDRIHSAKAIWRISNDKQVIPIIMEVLNTPKVMRMKGPCPVYRHHRAMALSVLGEISRDHPELFAYVLSFANDDDEQCRESAMREMRHFGKKGIPTLLKGLEDQDELVRLMAAESLRTMLIKEKETVAALERLVLSEDPSVRERAVELLIAIDPQRFGHLKKGQ